MHDAPGVIYYFSFNGSLNQSKGMEKTGISPDGPVTADN